MIAKERLWKTDKGNIVGEGHKDAHSLLCGIGQEVPKEYRGMLNDGCVETKAGKKKREANEAVELQKKKDDEELERMEKEEKEKKEAEEVKNKEKTADENKGGVTVNKK
jgi:hypothetical protein